MSNDAALREVKRSLVENAGGYLRNTVHIPGETCSICRGTQMNDGWHTCYPCDRTYRGAADLVGTMVYGVSDAQSGKLMHQYKLSPERPTLVQRVRSLATVGVKDHFACASILLGGDPSHWATVPSLKNIGSEHPLRRLILTPMLGAEFEIEVAASPLARGLSERDRREFNSSLYAVRSEVPPNARVLLVDDTWTGGGHIQSVAALLKSAGAERVAALAIARWLDMKIPRTKRIYSELIRPRPYNPSVCPWTGGGCPTVANPFAQP